MIAHLRGDVIKTAENEIILDVNGVGYSVVCSRRIVDIANANPHNLSIFTELIIRDVSWTLFGFLTEQEKEVFDTLLSVQGVGGRLAIAILSEFTAEELYNILLSEDKRTLCKASGVGDKLASRIIAELKNKVAKMNITPTTSSNPAAVSNRALIDARSALSNLGYSMVDINAVLSDPEVNEETEFDQILRLALRKLLGANK